MSRQISVHLELSVPGPSVVAMEVRYQKPGLRRHLPFRSTSSGVVLDIVGKTGRPGIIETGRTLLVGLRDDTCPLIYRNRPVISRVKDPASACVRVKRAMREFRAAINERAAK